MFNNKESRNNMTIGQKIKKAKNIYAWVLIYAPDDGEYLKVSKKHLRQVMMNIKGGLSEDVFRLDDDGDLYVNQSYRRKKEYIRGRENLSRM